MDFGIFNLMGSRRPDKPTAQVFGEVAEQTRLADTLGYTIAWFAEHHFSNYWGSREEGMRFAENARYQSRLASSLRRRQEVMQGTILVDVPFPDEPPVETIYENLLIGDVETVAQKLVAEIHATKPEHVCFSFKVGDTPHAAAMRSMELMIGEVKPRVEKALGPVEHAAAE